MPDWFGLLNETASAGSGGPSLQLVTKVDPDAFLAFTAALAAVRDALEPFHRDLDSIHVPQSSLGTPYEEAVDLFQATSNSRTQILAHATHLMDQLQALVLTVKMSQDATAATDEDNRTALSQVLTRIYGPDQQPPTPPQSSGAPLAATRTPSATVAIS